MKPGISGNVPNQHLSIQTKSSQQADKSLTASKRISLELTGYRSLSLPAGFNILQDQEITPLNTIHGRVIHAILTDQDNSGFSAFTKAIHASVEGNNTTTGPHTVPDTMIQTLMQIPLTIKLMLTRQQITEKCNDHASKTNLQDLAKLFKAQHVEIGGSTAKSIIAGNGIPPKSSDLDVVMYIDMKKFSSDPVKRNQQLVSLYCDYFKIPKNKELRERSVLPFLNHSFGCTFKPIVDMAHSHRFDITLIDSNKFPLNQSSDMKIHIPRWDNIQSSLKAISSNGITSKVNNLLSLPALNYLEKRGLLVFNPLMLKDGGLARIKKAVMKYQPVSYNQKLHSLQPDLIQGHYKAADAYQKHLFRMQNNNEETIPVLTFKELLDEHTAILDAYQRKTLNTHDLQSLDICLAEVAYTHLRSITSDDAHYADKQVYRTHCAAISNKDGLAQKHLLSILESPIDYDKLHPISRMWLEALMEKTKFDKPLSGNARINWLHYTTQHKSSDPDRFKNKIDGAFELIDRDWKNKSSNKKLNLNIRKDDFRKSIINMADEKASCQVLVSWIQRNPEDEQCLQKLCDKAAKLDTANASEIEKFILGISISDLKDPKSLLAIIELSLNDRRDLDNNQWNEKLNEALISFVNSANVKKDFTEFDRIMRSHFEIDEFHETSIAETLKSLPNLSEFADTMKSKTPTLRTLHAINFMLGQSILESIDFENNASQHKGYKQALAYFEAAGKSTAYALQAGCAALVCAIQIDDPDYALNLVSNIISKISKQEKNSSLFQELVQEVIGQIGFDTHIADTTLQKLTSITPLINVPSEPVSELTPHTTGVVSLLKQYMQSNINTISTKHYMDYCETILQLTNNFALLPNEFQSEYREMLNRVTAYDVKRTADKMQNDPDMEPSEETSEDINKLYERAIARFNAIQNLTAEDIMHLGEIEYETGDPQKAFDFFQSSLFKDGTFVSHKLGETILSMGDDKQYKDSIEFLQRYIKTHNIDKKTIPVTLFTQYLVALKGGKTGLNDYDTKNIDLLINFLNIVKNSKFTKNKLVSTLNKSPHLNKYEEEEIDALTWAIDTALKQVSKNGLKDMTPFDFLKNMYQINDILQIDKRIDAINKTAKLTARDENFTNAETLNNFVSKQFSALLTASLDVKYFKKLLPDEKLIKQLNEIKVKSGKMVQKFSAFKAYEKQNDTMYDGILRAITTSYDFNQKQTTPENSLAIIKTLLNNAEHMNNTINAYTGSTSSSHEFMNKIEGIYGPYTESFIALSNETMLLLSILTDSTLPKESLKTIPSNYNRDQVIKMRQTALESMRTAISRAGTTATETDKAYAEMYIRMYIARSQTQYEKSESKAIQAKYKKSMRSAAEIMHKAPLNQVRSNVRTLLNGNYIFDKDLTDNAISILKRS